MAKLDHTHRSHWRGEHAHQAVKAHRVIIASNIGYGDGTNRALADRQVPGGCDVSVQSNVKPYRNYQILDRLGTRRQREDGNQQKADPVQEVCPSKSFDGHCLPFHMLTPTPSVGV